MSAIALSNPERFTLPLHALTVSDANVRKVSPSDIDSLGASILADGVLNNLVVIASKKKKGSPVSHEVVAGRRRFLALMYLLSEEKITLDYAVPVLLKERNNATVSSLVENFHREPMHPIDQFKSFCKLSDEGLSVTEIALRLGILETHVRQRLALGSASPELLEEALSDRMTLEQLKVLCQVESHETQNEIWFNTPEGWQRSPQKLREKIKGEVVKVSNKLVTFVGLDCYQENGGSVGFDLFDDKESTINDPDLLASLAVAKLTALVESLGWSWCEIALDIDHDRVRGFKRVYQSEREMTEPEAAAWGLWETRFDELENLLYGSDDSIDDSGDALSSEQSEYDELVAVMEKFQNGLKEWGDAKSVGGAYAYVDNNGQAAFIEGLVRKQDAAALEPDNNNVSCTVSTPTDKGMSGSLREYLACVRASIMQAEVVKNPHIGLALLCQSLVLSIFYRSWSSYNQLDASLSLHSDSLTKHGLEDLPSSLYISNARDKWQARLPDEANLLDFLLGLDALELGELMVFCSSYALKLHNPGGDADTRYASLCGLLDTDVAAYWQPTAENFFNRLNKPLIFDALNHAGVDTGGLSDKMKKSELAARAGDLVKQSPNWLPDVLSV